MAVVDIFTQSTKLNVVIFQEFFLKSHTIFSTLGLSFFDFADLKIEQKIKARCIAPSLYAIRLSS